nr:fk506-binding protein 2 [Quercus suber]
MLSTSLLSFAFAALGAAVTTLDSGLSINTTTAVSCSRPSKHNDRIAVHYRGTFQSTGKEFDESYKTGRPYIFVLGAGRVIRGWDIGLLDMCPGEERILTIPPELAYGKDGGGPIPPDSTLIFATKLVEIIGVKQQFLETVVASPTSAIASASETAELLFNATASETEGSLSITTASVAEGALSMALGNETGRLLSVTTTSETGSLLSIGTATGTEASLSITTPSWIEGLLAMTTATETGSLLSIANSSETAETPSVTTPSGTEGLLHMATGPEMGGLLSTTTTGLLSTTTMLPIATISETEAMLSIATAPAIPVESVVDKIQEAPGAGLENTNGLTADVIFEENPARPAAVDGPKHPGKQAECHLLGPFALLVQAALGGMALLTLVWKRYRETPKRPWKIFFFDVSKQVLGSMLTHVLNLAMSMLSSVAIVNQTTIGIPVLYVLLKILHALASLTPLARPSQSIKSGNYGQPPYHTTWWLKQLLIYFIGLVGMKLFVFFLFSALPWLPWVGDWALRWTQGNEALEVTFAMFIFPLAMNAVQYWIIDNFIMEKKGKDEGKGDYVVVQDDDDEGFHGEGATDVGDEDDVAKNGPLTEVNPTPIPAYDSESSRSVSAKDTDRKLR